MAQAQDGSTVDADVSVNGSGTTVYSFRSPFDTLIDLGSVSSVTVIGTALDDSFDLAASSSDVIYGGAGNNVYYTAKGASDLNGDVLRGGKGVNIVKIGGSGQEIDLTQGSTGIEAVVGGKSLTGEIVDLKLNELAASTLTGSGKAFVALIGTDGIVNATEVGKIKLVGELDAAGHGFAADGTALNPTATAALQGLTTSIENVQGSLALLYSGGSELKNQSYVPDALNAYVFSDGTTSYTVWTDGTVQPIDTKGNFLPRAYQPAAASDPTATLGTISLYDQASGASAKLSTTPQGNTAVTVGDGLSGAYAAITVGPVSSTTIRGDEGANGGDIFNLAKSGGGNIVIGSPANNIFDLGNSAGLVDQLKGGAGFNTVLATGDGADIDLTTGNGSTGLASSGIDAVVGAVKTTQTAEVGLTTLKTTTDATGAKTAFFEAFLGSSADTATVSGSGFWRETAVIEPGGALPAHATALTNTATLDALFHATKSHTAENSMIGYVFEQDTKSGTPIEYVTVWTDATLAAAFAHPVTLIGTTDAAS